MLVDQSAVAVNPAQPFLTSALAHAPVSQLPLHPCASCSSLQMLALNEEHIAVLSDAAGVFTHAASGALPPPVQAALMRFAELRGGSGAAAATVATEEGRQALLSEAASRGALAALLAAPAASLQKMAFDLAAATCAGSSPVSSCHSGALADAAALLHLSADTSVAVAQAPFEPSSCNFQDLQQPAAGGSYGSYSGAGTAVVARGSAAALAADPAAAAPPLPSGMALLMVLTPDVAQRLSVPDVVGMWRELVLSLKR